MEFLKTFVQGDEGKYVRGTYSNGTIVEGTILSVWHLGFRVDIRVVLNDEGAWRIDYGVPSAMLTVIEKGDEKDGISYTTHSNRMVQR